MAELATDTLNPTRRTFMKSTDIPYIPRDVSWLSFNYRVLQEAKDQSVPLFERIKFLAIYSSNLDEFFRVRVAHQRNLVRAGKKAKRELQFEPKQVTKSILALVNSQQEEFSDIFENEIIPALKTHGIRLKRRQQLTEAQRDFVESYFRDHMLPFVQPVLLVKHKIRPFLNNGALYLAIHLEERDVKSPAPEYAIIKIPSDHLPRFLTLPSMEGRYDIIMLDDIVRHSVQSLFPGYHIIDTYSIKLTRDAELYIDDEFSGDLVSKIRKSLAKRNVGPPSRFVYDREMPKELLQFLMEAFDLNRADLLPEGRYHNNMDFFGFPDFGMSHLSNPELTPLSYLPLEAADDFFGSIAERDHLIHVPYESYHSVVRLFEEAASDPKVTHIKIVQYRVAAKSRIMNALMSAVQHGKQVTVFVEVKARFDEEANLTWGERLERAGVNVHYSFPGLKVHSKLALVIREEDDGPKLYSYLATGNFHEKTARIYGDFGLFTADTRLTDEVSRVFNFLETVKLPSQDFEHLLVGQFNLRSTLVALLNREIAFARMGKEARILLKVNSLEDRDMIAKLYEASQAGVEVQLIVRGICCLVPGVKGVSDNISVISIVDRFLEHARVFIFHNDGEEDIYLSSADWMRRNLSYRIETAFPIYDEHARQEIKDTLDLQLRDNVKARVVDQEQANTYVDSPTSFAIRSQIETYYRLKRRQELPV